MGDMELQVFADRLKKLRAEKGLTQAEFIKDLGITASALSAYEKNLKNPSISVAKRIAEKYNVSIDWLCGLSDTIQHDSINIKTYSDIIKLWSESRKSLSTLEKISNNFQDKMRTFIHEAMQMEKLKNDKMIDDELYDLWIEKSIKKYNYPIMMHYLEKPVDPFILPPKVSNGQTKIRQPEPEKLSSKTTSLDEKIKNANQRTEYNTLTSQPYVDRAKITDVDKHTQD